MKLPSEGLTTGSASSRVPRQSGRSWHEGGPSFGVQGRQDGVPVPTVVDGTWVTRRATGAVCGLRAPSAPGTSGQSRGVARREPMVTEWDTDVVTGREVRGGRSQWEWEGPSQEGYHKVPPPRLQTSTETLRSLLVYFFIYSCTISFISFQLELTT